MLERQFPLTAEIDVMPLNAGRFAAPEGCGDNPDVLTGTIDSREPRDVQAVRPNHSGYTTLRLEYDVSSESRWK